MSRERLHLRLPATSANLGPGFDALGLAMALWLDVRAEVADQTTVAATGRDADLVGASEGNLLLDTYRAVSADGPPLQLTVHNEIPLGMGCGSSAAALLAGVMLANHFGALGWSGTAVLNEACRREGHPDNVAACYFGGVTASSMRAGTVTAATFGRELDWRLLLALPGSSLATEKARGLLPDFYSRLDVVENIQATALLVAACALNKPGLLREATRDRMHQPYRAEACPLLPRLLPLAGKGGVAAVTLSGAGPSVLLILDKTASVAAVSAQVRTAARDEELEVVETKVSGGVVTGEVHY